jgi:hypothetical protein
MSDDVHRNSLLEQIFSQGKIGPVHSTSSMEPARH